MTEAGEPIKAELNESREAQKVLSAAQVALWLHLPKERVQEMAESGALPARLIAGEWRFGALAINRWLSGDRATGGLAELEDAIEQLTVRVIDLAARVDPLLAALPKLPQGRMISEGADVAFDVPDGLTLEDLETQYIRYMMQKHQHNKTHVASALGVDPSTLYRKLARLGW